MARPAGAHHDHTRLGRASFQPSFPLPERNRRRAPRPQREARQNLFTGISSTSFVQNPALPARRHFIQNPVSPARRVVDEHGRLHGVFTKTLIINPPVVHNVFPRPSSRPPRLRLPASTAGRCALPSRLPCCSNTWPLHHRRSPPLFSPPRPQQVWV